MATTKTPRKLAHVKTKTYSVCMLYNTNDAREKLKSLSVAACNPGTDDQTEIFASETDRDVEMKHGQKHIVSDKMQCNCCDCMFEDRKEQEQHYKSDWHRYNLRLKLGGFKSMTIEFFEKIADDVSSISGSEDEEDSSDGVDKTGVRVKTKLTIPAHIQHSSNISVTSSDSETETVIVSPGKTKTNSVNKLYLKTQDGELVSIYKCLLYHKKNRITDQAELIQEVKTLPSKINWAIFMSAGGHFAGAIFNGNKIIVHKTFHRYVVRAKRGTAQSGKDSQGNAPKSAGATLRRYNEAALLQEVQDWMATWSEQMKNCDFLFLRAPSFNRKIFYGGKNPQFIKNDARVRVIPFPTRRPTYNEVRRVHELLSSIECYGPESELTNVIPISPMRQLSSETGQLEVVPDAEVPSPRHSKNGTASDLPARNTYHKAKKDRGQVDEESVKLSLPDHVLVESESTSSEGELVEVMTVIYTDHLKEYDCCIGKPRKKSSPKKKRKNITKHQVEPEGNIYDEERYHLQNALFTACSTGDTQTLSALLVVLRGKDITPCDLTPASSDNIVTSSSTQPPSESEHLKNDESSEDLNSTKENSTNSSENLDVNRSHNTKPDNRESKVPDTLPLPCFSMRFGGYTLDQLSPLVTVDIMNKPFGDNNTTLLHVAAKNNHKRIISMLMKYGADPALKDKAGRPPYDVSGTKDTKNEFRRFQAVHPDRYDYQLAQIPGPLTAEKEEEKKLRDMERKRIQKKAKAEKIKIQKEKEEEHAAEDREKKRFLNLSDREKRLLAAERRLVNQCENQGAEKPVLSRCYGCGTDMTGKVPFEYSNFKFCTTKCLREHRSKNS